MDEELFVTPEETVSEPPRRRGRRKKLIGNTADSVLDSVEPTPEPKRKPGRPKGSGKPRSYAAEIEQGFSFLFMGAGVKFGPAFPIPSPLLPPEMQQTEAEQLHTFAVELDKWLTNLPEDSRVRQWLSKTAEASPLLLATAALARLGTGKIMLHKAYLESLQNESGTPR